MDQSNTRNGHDRINVIFQDEYGYVVACRCCKNLQIGFGNFTVDQCPNELERFSEIISGMVQKHQYNPESPNAKSIVLPTPYPGFNLLFTYTELQRLNNLLQTTLLIIRAESLANLS